MPVDIFKSKLTPAVFMSPAKMETIRESALMTAVARAKSGKPQDAFDARALLPSDLGETNELWGHITGSSGNVWENSLINNQQIADDTWVAIYGLIDTSQGPFISAIRWFIGSGMRQWWAVDDYFSDDRSLLARTAYAESPIVITPRQFLTIEYYVRGVGGTNQSVQIAYLGWVVEKKGKNIQP